MSPLSRFAAVGRDSSDGETCGIAIDMGLGAFDRCQIRPTVGHRVIQPSNAEDDRRIRYDVPPIPQNPRVLNQGYRGLTTSSGTATEVLQETHLDGLYSHHGNYEPAWDLPWGTNDTPTAFNCESNLPADWTMNQHRISTGLRAPEPAQSRHRPYSETGLSQGAAKASTVTSAPLAAQSAEHLPEVPVDKAALIEKICDINKQLYDHATTLPPDPLDRSLGTGTTRSSSAATSPETQENQEPTGLESTDIRSQTASSHSGDEFAIDKTFALSHELIGVLNQLYPRFIQKYPDQDAPSHQPQTRSPSTLMQRHDATTAPSVPRTPCSLDEGSVLLILSSYLRVINIYETIFSHIQLSINETYGRAGRTAMRLPRLNIGAFSLPSCSVMEITVIIQLAEQLLSRLREITGLMDSYTRGEDHDAERGHDQGKTISCTDATLRCLRSRERELVKRTTQVKRSLLQLNIL
ncbi:hypothetical protein MMC30_004274 [Trapelia coarctata]|nr:hypothetical protein [Trapelia coarctata]